MAPDLLHNRAWEQSLLNTLYHLERLCHTLRLGPRYTATTRPGRPISTRKIRIVPFCGAPEQHKFAPLLGDATEQAGQRMREEFYGGVVAWRPLWKISALRSAVSLVCGAAQWHYTCQLVGDSDYPTTQCSTSGLAGLAVDWSVVTVLQRSGQQIVGL